VSGVANITLRGTGRDWTVHISMDEDIARHVGIQTMPLRIAEAVINTLDQTLPYSVNSLSINLGIRDTTGLCGGIIKWLSTRKLISKICINTIKPN